MYEYFKLIASEADNNVRIF